MSNKGKFFVLEGGEGSGKTTCLDFLRKELSPKNDFLFTREPGGTEVGEAVREVLMHKNMTIKTELFLFCGVRSEVIDKIIKPALNSGKHVICDRFYPSTRTYQIHKNSLGKEYLDIFNQLNKITVGDCKPDAVIYLDVTPEIGLERKSKSQEGLCTRFDNAKLEDHYRIRNGYLMQYAEAVKNRTLNPAWYMIPTDNLKEHEVQKMTFHTILSLINLYSLMNK